MRSFVFGGFFVWHTYKVQICQKVGRT